jgi:general secretion pathway protein G
MKIKDKTCVRYRGDYPREIMAEAVPIEGRAALGNRGFTLLELLVVILIIGILIAIAVPGYTELKNSAKISRCAEEIRGIEKAIGSYQADHGSLPDSLDDLKQGTFKDAWGNPYVYLKIGNTPPLPQLRYDGHFVWLNEDFDLYSMGEDGISTYDLFGGPMAAASANDIIRAADGGYVGLAEQY